MAKHPPRVPDRSEISNETPLRLQVALALAFPDGGMTVPSLRRERNAGRLSTCLIAGKEFTTLDDIARMVAACRRAPPSSSSGDAQPSSAPPATTELGMAQQACRAKLHALIEQGSAEALAGRKERLQRRLADIAAKKAARALAKYAKGTPKKAEP